MHERRLKGVLEQHELSQVAIAGLMTGREHGAGVHPTGKPESSVEGEVAPS